jgi:hypothetical protein
MAAYRNLLWATLPLVLMLAGLAVFFHSAFALSAILITTAALTGECSRDFFLHQDGQWRFGRTVKVLCVLLVVLVAGLTFNVPLLIIPAYTGLIALVYAAILRDLDALFGASQDEQPSA